MTIRHGVLIAAAVLVTGCSSGSTVGSWHRLPATSTTTPLHQAASALTVDQQNDLRGLVGFTPQEMDATEACLSAGPGLADATCRASADRFLADLTVLDVMDSDPLAGAVSELALAKIHAELKLEALERCEAATPGPACDDALATARTAVLDLYRVVVFDKGLTGAPNAG